jgi:hypothetical protein
MDPADEFHSPYVYVGGDPVNLVDPDGRQSCGSCVRADQDNRAVLQGEMSPEEHRARREARGQGLRYGLEMLADTGGDLFELVTGRTVTGREGSRGSAIIALALPGVTSSAIKFIVAKNGATVPVPKRFTQREADSGKGLVFQAPEAPRGTNQSSIRIMDPVTTGQYQYPEGYMRYYNASGGG